MWRKYISFIFSILLVGLILYFEKDELKTIFWDLKLNRLTLKIVGTLTVVLAFIGRYLFKVTEKKLLFEICALALAISSIFVLGAVDLVNKYNTIGNISSINCSTAEKIRDALKQNKYEHHHFFTDKYYDYYYVLSKQAGESEAININATALQMEQANFIISLIEEQVFRGNGQIPEGATTTLTGLTDDIYIGLRCPPT